MHVINWLPISEAPKDVPIWLFSKEFIDLDFNQTGVVDGCWGEDEGWVIWGYDGCNDCYTTIRNSSPTHFALKVNPHTR